MSHRRHISRPRAHGFGGLYGRAMDEIDTVVAASGGHAQHLRIERLSGAIDEMRRRVEQSDAAVRQARLVALLLLQTPRAARAQDAMDRRHGHNYRHRSKRLYELIDFNDTFVDTVLALRAEQRHEFMPRIYRAMREVCQRARTHMFTYEQFEAIAHGLSREIAVYLGAQKEGYDVHMTSRVADGLGVDMQVREPESQRYINIDCKTTSAYGYRLATLVREGRVSERAAALAMAKGYIRVTNGHGDDRVHVVLFCVAHEVIGDIRDFEFAQTDVLGAKLREMIAAYGVDGDGFYRYEVD